MRSCLLKILALWHFYIFLLTSVPINKWWHLYALSLIINQSIFPHEGKYNNIMLYFLGELSLLPNSLGLNHSCLPSDNSFSWNCWCFCIFTEGSKAYTRLTFLPWKHYWTQTSIILLFLINKYWSNASICWTELSLSWFWWQVSTYAIRDMEEYKNFCDRPKDQRPLPEEVIEVRSPFIF